MRNVLVTTVFVLAAFASSVRSAHAGVCDLTVGGSTCDSFGAIYTNVLPTGTYYIDPFLQLKSNGSEQGYNTSGDTSTKPGTQYQFNQTGTTRALSTSELTATTIGSTSYYAFILNIDEPGSDPKLTLDQLQIFLSPSNTLTNYEVATRSLDGLTAIYDLDSGGTNNWVNLNYSLQSGRTGTMIVYVPTSLFTQPGYIYLYSQFGATGFTAGGSLEEWWIRTNGTSGTAITAIPNPEPGTLVMVGSVLAFGVRRLRKRRQIPLA
jgi:hypothetical protein